MNQPVRTSALLACALLTLAGAAEAQQQSSQSPASQPTSQQDQYQGQSNPPTDDVIQTAQPEQIAKPRAGTPMTAPQAAAPVQAPVQTQAQYSQAAPPAPAQNTAYQDSSYQGASYQGADSGTVQVAPPPVQAAPAPQPALVTRSYSNDPDGDIVHPQTLPPGTLEEGTRIHVRLLTELSSTRTEKGDVFRSRVDADVLQGGLVLIPAGSEIVGKIVEASAGHFGGHGSLRLRPETVVLPNGAQYMMVARLADATGTKSRVNSEGSIEAGPRYKRDGVEYGGGVGTGVVAGAVLGGPAGALAGGLIGAGAVTLHLMLDHPQATLEPGSSLLFTLTDRLSLVSAQSGGN